MELRPIRTDEDRRAALAEIETPWDAPTAAPRGTRLEKPEELVEAYEREHYPMDPPTLGQ